MIDNPVPNPGLGDRDNRQEPTLIPSIHSVSYVESGGAAVFVVGKKVGEDGK